MKGKKATVAKPSRSGGGKGKNTDKFPQVTTPVPRKTNKRLEPELIESDLSDGAKDRRAAEEELARSERKLRYVFDCVYASNLWVRHSPHVIMFCVAIPHYHQERREVLKSD